MKIVSILGVGYGNSSDDIKYLYEIYNKIQNTYPDFLKKDFEFHNGFELHIPMYKELPDYNYIIEMVKKYNLRTRYYERTYYTNNEIKKADFFCARLSYPLESEGSDITSYGTKYVDMCNKCKVGGFLADDILIDKKFIRKRGIFSLKKEIVLSKEIKTIIENYELKGVSFKHCVKDYRGREMEEYYCMTVHNILSPVNSRTLCDYNPPALHCELCGRTIPYLLSNLYYTSDDLGNALDFNLTYEYFNNFNERYLIVSKKVKEIFDKHKIRMWYNMINIV